MTEKKQTAVEYLLHAAYKIVELNPNERRRLNEVVEKAKEMEKEQIEEAFFEGTTTPEYIGLIYSRSPEEYYNRTFKTNEK